MQSVIQVQEFVVVSPESGAKNVMNVNRDMLWWTGNANVSGKRERRMWEPKCGNNMALGASFTWSIFV